MKTAFAFLDGPARSAKPRESGVTMVLDKNLSVTELENIVAVSADYMDLVKFGWCTSAVSPRDLVRQKCEILRANDIHVCPGGTLMELAFVQGKLPQFLAEARSLGFSCIEVSNGVVPISETDKLDCIKRALDLGFRVVSEVGSKIVEEDDRLHLEQRVEQTRRELECGVWKVIMESRESGTLGIFDSKGKTQMDLLRSLVEALNVDDLIFEAPLKQQQVDLILRLGNRVNLGNIPPQDVVPLETLRLGMRGDTLRHYHLALPKVRVELGAGGALSASQRGDVIVVVDAIRATSTIVTALANGITSVKPVATAEDCVGEITAGERGGRKIPQLDYDNSPVAFCSDRFRGKQLVLTSTNGTECIMAAASNSASTVIIGALLNVSAVAQFALETARTSGRNITVVIAGRNNRPAPEDVIVASEIISQLHGAPVESNIPLITSTDFVLDFLNSESGRNLSSLGRSEDIIFCGQKDKYDVVPIFKNGLLGLVSGAAGK
jgi:2-phosphosulfolactate phosphatase